MELPENVVPMPAEQREELKRLAQAATPGPWRSCWEDEPDANDLNEVAIASTASSLGGVEKFVMGLIWYDGPHAGCTIENAAYIAAVSPDVALAALRYIEHLEARVANYQRREKRGGETWLITKQFITTQGQELNEARARLSTVEAANAELKQELAEQEAEKLLLVEQLPPECDGGIWALQSLADYCREAGHYAALDNIRAAAHNLGWCIDDGGADQIVPTTGTCPLCDYDSGPRPAPFERAPLLEEAVPAAELLNQLPGCPAAKCHGCGLPSHAARC